MTECRRPDAGGIGPESGPDARQMVRRVRRGSRLALALAGLTLLAAGCEQQETATSAEIRPVRFAQAFVAGTESVRTFPGVARAASEQDLGFRVSGTLTAVEVVVGSEVQSGQVLARLDPGDLELRRQQAAAGLAQAHAQARNAEAQYERAVGLYESGGVSMSDLDAARAGYESASASEVSAKTALRLAEQQVAYTRLVAPVDGLVNRSLVEVNEAVAAGQPVMTVIVTGESLEVEVTVPEGFIGGLRAGRPARVVFGALGDASLAATLTEIGTAAAGAGGFPVTLRLAESANSAAVRPGMAAEVTFSVETRTAPGVVLVAPRAVGEDQNGRFVYVLERSGTDDIATANRRAVVTGALTPAGLEIVSGVSDGEYVATAGLRTLAQGQRVRLLEAPAG